MVLIIECLIGVDVSFTYPLFITHTEITRPGNAFRIIICSRQQLMRNNFTVCCSSGVVVGAPGDAVSCKLHKIQDPDGTGRPQIEQKPWQNPNAQIASFVGHGQT